MIGVMLALISTVFAAFGAIALKKGVSGSSKTYLSLGLFLSGFAVFLFIISLQWGYLSLLYSIGSISYVLVTFLAAKILKEKMTLHKWIGISLIIAGIILISVS